MKLRDFLFIGFFFSHLVYSETVVVALEQVRNNQLNALREEYPIAEIEDYSSLNIHFRDQRRREFARVSTDQTTIAYNQVLTCHENDYITIMLQSDGSYESGRYVKSVTRNRLYIYSINLNMIKYDYSLYRSERLYWETDEDVLNQHHFTLDNLEEYACSQVKKELTPKIVEKTLSSKKTYNEYTIGKIQAMFDGYPLSKRNVTQYNNVAYYFEKNKAYEQSAFILEKLLKQYPSRTVAYINLGDAYWGMGEKEKAKIAYQKYVELMKASDKEDLIPEKLLERI